MKIKNITISLVLLAGFIFLLSSCKKKDTDLLKGTWTFSTITVDITPDNKVVKAIIESYTEDFINIAFPMASSTITFNDNDTFEQAYNNNGNIVISKGSYSLNNEKITLIYDDASIPSITSPYVISDKALTLRFNMQPLLSIDITQIDPELIPAEYRENIEAFFKLLESYNFNPTSFMANVIYTKQ